MAGCSFCGGLHAALYICPERQAVAAKLASRGVTNPNGVTNIVTNGKRSSAERQARKRAKNPEAYRAYQRELMRARRARLAGGD